MSSAKDARMGKMISIVMVSELCMQVVKNMKGLWHNKNQILEKCKECKIISRFTCWF